MIPDSQLSIIDSHCRWQPKTEKKFLLIKPLYRPFHIPRRGGIALHAPGEAPRRHLGSSPAPSSRPVQLPGSPHRDQLRSSRLKESKHGAILN